MQRFSSAFLSTRSRDNARSAEFRYAAAFEGSSLKQLLVEVCDLAVDRSWGVIIVISKNPLCKVGGRLDVEFEDEVCQVAETQAIYLSD